MADTATARIRAVITGRPTAAYVEVLADDVAAVCESVPEANRTPVVLALHKGARGAPVKINGDGERVPCPVHIEAGKLAQILEAAPGGNAQ